MEFRCCKCTHTDIFIQYDSMNDLLNCDCRRCGYHFVQDPEKKEPKPEPVVVEPVAEEPKVEKATKKRGWK